MSTNKIDDINHRMKSTILLHSKNSELINKICNHMLATEYILHLFRNKNFILDLDFFKKINQEEIDGVAIFYLISMKNISHECMEAIWFELVEKNKINFYTYCCQTILENQKTIPEKILKNITQTIDLESEDISLTNLKRIIKILNIKFPS